MVPLLELKVGHLCFLNDEVEKKVVSVESYAAIIQVVGVFSDVQRRERCGGVEC